MRLSSGEVVSVVKRHLSLKLWNGAPVPDTYGGKAVLDYNGQPLFAELVVLRMLEGDGWEGVWGR